MDVYFNIGIITIIGLASKNAILIVEFAKDLHDQGRSVVDSTMEAVRLRFRPILMTSLAFILGVLPLVISSGAGAAGRRAIGTGVMGGMITATGLGLFFIPLVLRRDPDMARQARRAASAAADRRSRQCLSAPPCSLALLLAGCSMQPKYVQPALPTAPQYPAYAGPAAAGPRATDVEWRSFFRDPRLQALIATALDNNRDLRTAVLRIDEARGQYRIQRADQVPNVDATAGASRSRIARLETDFRAITSNRFDVGASVASFELDFWGRVRSLTEFRARQLSVDDPCPARVPDQPGRRRRRGLSHRA